MPTRCCGITAGGLDADLPTTYAALEKVLLDGSEDFGPEDTEFPVDPRRDVDSQEDGY